MVLLADRLRAGLRAAATLDALVDTVRSFKDSGGSQDEAYRVLERLRGEPELGDAEDRILELMDIVSGWCAPAARIW